jgi:hypothetical protein
VRSGGRNRGQEGRCGLNIPEVVHGGLGLGRGRWRGPSASALAGVAVWTRPTAWTVLLDACKCRLARVRCWPERHPAGARPRSGGSGRRGFKVKEREGRRACASRLLDISSPHARERERRGESVESRAGTCPGRRGRRRLGVDWGRWCTSALGSSPGNSARSAGAAARAGSVGGTEGRSGLRGVRPGSLSRAWSTLGARVNPRGWQVG